MITYKEVKLKGTLYRKVEGHWREHIGNGNWFDPSCSAVDDLLDEVYRLRELNKKKACQ